MAIAGVVCPALFCWREGGVYGVLGRRGAFPNFSPNGAWMLAVSGPAGRHSWVSEEVESNGR